MPQPANGLSRASVFDPQRASPATAEQSRTGNAGGDDMHDGRDLDFELLRQAFLTLAQGHLVQAGDEGRDFLRGLERSIPEAVATAETGRLDTPANAAFQHAAERVRAVLQEALEGKDLDRA
ncbi:hypothetical protein [Methylobacterium sp. OAE515]|uniref:hypothetical protein n=1 Tax=Methylobacterium sp. OAE515 TaxID=2817895 RepID=UPI00178A3D95